MTRDELAHLASAGWTKWFQYGHGREGKFMCGQHTAAQYQDAVRRLLTLVDLLESDVFEKELTEQIIEAWLYSPDTWEHVAEQIAGWLREKLA